MSSLLHEDGALESHTPEIDCDVRPCPFSILTEASIRIISLQDHSSHELRYLTSASRMITDIN